jgi:hypothetical protein
MAKRISQLPEETSVADNDQLPLYDVSTGTTKRATVTNVLAGIIDGTDLGNNTITSEKLKATVAFAAYSSAAITASATPAKVQLATEEFDEGADFDATTNYRFTAPYAGIYSFTAQVTFTTPGDGNNIQGFLYKNGAAFTNTIVENFNVGGANTPTLNLSAVVKLAANDYVELFAARATTSGNATGRLSGFLVGRT